MANPGSSTRDYSRLKKGLLTVIGLAAYSALFVYLVFAKSFTLFPEPKHAVKISAGDQTVGIYQGVQDLNNASWKPVSLADDWHLQNVDDTDAWYRFKLSTDIENSEVAAVYIPTVRQNFSIYLNGQWLAQGGPFTNNRTQMWRYPQYLEFPTARLNGDDTIYLRLQTHLVDAAYLSPIYIGDHEELHPLWQWHRWVKVDLLLLISHLLIIVGLINLALWALRRNESFYFWYEVAALVWGASGYMLLDQNPPLELELWAALRLMSLGVGVVAVLLFNLRFFEIRDRKIDFLMFIYCVPMAIPMLFMSVDALQIYGHQFWARICLLIAAYTSYRLIKLYVLQNEVRALFLLLTGMPLFVLGAHDFLLLTERLDPQNGFLINYGTPPALFLAMWFILQRFSHSLKKSEQLNVTLDRRVREKEAEIEQHYQQRESLRKQQLLSAERERIMRDMHDGIGGHLVGLKALAENQPGANDMRAIRNQTNRALADLRFVISSLDATSQSIPSLLGAMRSRWQQLSAANNKALHWEVSSIENAKELGPHTTLQIMRILEEAFTNCLKHSGGSEIHIQNGVNDDGQWVQIADNGCVVGPIKAGKGINNMEYRANDIGAELSVDGQKSGCRVVLRIPEPSDMPKN